MNATEPTDATPLLIVLSGPSGVGKDLLLSHMRASSTARHFAVTATTRVKRSAERDGVDYHFVSKARFEAMIAADELLEWAPVYGNYYGVPKAQIADALAQGKDVIVKIDVQGAATVRRIAPDALFIFLAPPSIAELERRLAGRLTETEEALALRLNTARRELAESTKYDYVVTHHTHETAAAAREIEAIIDRERARERRPLAGMGGAD